MQDGDNPRPKKKKKLMKKKTKRRGEDFQIYQEQILLLPVSIFNKTVCICPKKYSNMSERDISTCTAFIKVLNLDLVYL